MSSAQQVKYLDLEAQPSDASPLMMDNESSAEQFHIVDIVHESPSISSSQNQSLDFSATLTDTLSFQSASRHQTTDFTGTAPTIEPSTYSVSEEARDVLGARYRVNPLNSGLWISIELTITISQIFASTIVLSLSRHENPQTPLAIWVTGYSAGCLATLPLLYWRYTLARKFELGAASEVSVPPFDSNSSDRRSHLPLLSSRNNSRVERLVENFKIALDCYFAVWFVVGNVWVFGGHSSSIEAPILYRLCIVFLTFSCIGYAMPFILCATICCCLPCIISLLGFREEHPLRKGASPEIIASLPTFKFKAKDTKEKQFEFLNQENELVDKYFDEDSYIMVGKEMERAISADDALCCICLGNYTDGVDLRELPCFHHFHVACVDTWLNISPLCPLCKFEIGSSHNQQKLAPVETQL